MTHTVNWLDRLRIERRVWGLDQHLYDLPRAQRIATRRDVRANLREAAADVGTTEALRRVGSSRRLAEQYLAAEFGDRPRHSWMGAFYAAFLVPLTLDFFLAEADNAFQSGVTSADPHATGTYLWSGVSLLQSEVTYSFSNGTASTHGGAWTPFTYVAWAVITISAGRLWRIRRRRHPAAANA
ncbi:hypothetical protein [Krasilnikovia sp. MM14-A1259]|uniref:hypothetical protein n=1 Tax=Krasilnikovia sp. MM14-A1259 TaxID=3373539 RepID=UPI00381219AA